MPQASDVQSSVLLFSCRAVPATGCRGFCQVCARFHGSYFSSFQTNLEACHYPLEGNWKEPGSLSYIATIADKFKATFPHSSPGYTLLPVFSSHIHGIMTFWDWIQTLAESVLAGQKLYLNNKTKMHDCLHTWRQQSAGLPTGYLLPKGNRP